MLIPPKKMAEIYANRLHRQSFGEVHRLLEQFKGSVKTVAYWKSVLECLNFRFPNNKQEKSNEDQVQA